MKDGEEARAELRAFVLSLPAKTPISSAPTTEVSNGYGSVDRKAGYVDYRSEHGGEAETEDERR